jgi:hypothetical protein
VANLRIVNEEPSPHRFAWINPTKVVANLQIVNPMTDDRTMTISLQQRSWRTFRSSTRRGARPESAVRPPMMCSQRSWRTFRSSTHRTRWEGQRPTSPTKVVANLQIVNTVIVASRLSGSCIPTKVVANLQIVNGTVPRRSLPPRRTLQRSWRTFRSSTQCIRAFTPWHYVAHKGRGEPSDRQLVASICYLPPFFVPQRSWRTFESSTGFPRPNWRNP